MAATVITTTKRNRHGCRVPLPRVPRADRSDPDRRSCLQGDVSAVGRQPRWLLARAGQSPGLDETLHRSEEHTAELQSRENLVCRHLLEKRYNKWTNYH